MRKYIRNVLILLFLYISTSTGGVAQISDPLVWSPIWEENPAQISRSITYHGHLLGFIASWNDTEYCLLARYADDKTINVFSRPNPGYHFDGFDPDRWVYKALGHYASGDNEVAFWASYEACIVDGGYNADTWKLLAALSHLTGRDEVVEMAIDAVVEIEGGQIGGKSSNLVRLVEPLEYASNSVQYAYLDEFQSRMHCNARPAPSKPVSSLGGPLPSYEFERQQLLDIFGDISKQQSLPLPTYVSPPYLATQPRYNVIRSNS